MSSSHSNAAAITFESKAASPPSATAGITTSHSLGHRGSDSIFPKITYGQRNKVVYALQAVAASRQGDLFADSSLRDSLAAYLDLYPKTLYDYLRAFPGLLEHFQGVRMLFVAAFEILEDRAGPILAEQGYKLQIPKPWVDAIQKGANQ